MLKRVANSLYWLSRYIERAENNARLLNVNLQLHLEFSAAEVDSRDSWEAIINSLADTELFFSLYKEADPKSVLDFVVFQPENPNSVLSCVSGARENARTIREQISTEMWEEINRSYLFITKSSTRREFRNNTYGSLERVIGGSQLFQGITDSTMNRSEGWQFIRLGRYADRADRTSRMMDVKYHILLPQGEIVGGNVDTIQWMAVLRSCSALEAFRKVHPGQVTPWNVAEFLITDEWFPRAIRFCVTQIDRALHAISGSSEAHFANEAERLSGRLRSVLTYSTVNDIFQHGLHEYLDQMQLRLIEVTAAMSQAYCEG